MIQSIESVLFIVAMFLFIAALHAIKYFLFPWRPWEKSDTDERWKILP
jgi:hypothetical protein